MPSDADWNYKDIPHLKNVHNLVDGFTAYAGDDFVGSIFIQKILGGLIKIPLSVVIYQSAKNAQTYFSTFFWFILIIHTNYEQIEEIRTRVTTRYALGTSGIMKLVFPIVFPVMKWLIKKNYDDLMTDDIPMRTRRGELRKMGYSFAGDGKDYSYVETTKIMKTNIVAPSDKKPSPPVLLKNILSALEKQSPVFYGEPDLFGFQAYKNGTKITFFPRACVHEGACLDHAKSGDGAVKCPWHGRLHKPLLEVDSLGTKIIAVRIDVENSIPKMVTE